MLCLRYGQAWRYRISHPIEIVVKKTGGGVGVARQTVARRKIDISSKQRGFPENSVAFQQLVSISG